MLLPYIAIVSAAHRDHLNLVLEAVGWGPGNFARRCCAINPAATSSTPATHYLTSAAAATDTDVAMLQAMTQGDLPDLPEGVIWGENGVISAADAMAASDGSVFHIYSAAGEIEPVDHAAAVLASEGLQYVPEPQA